MHSKALSLLRKYVLYYFSSLPSSSHSRLSEKESDTEDKIGPSVAYVKNLTEEYLDQIFDAVRWIHQYDANAAFDVSSLLLELRHKLLTRCSQIFTAEIQELPRSKVADFLEDELDPSLSARYLEYLINEREEMSTLFHDRLAELYLDMANDAKKRRDDGERAKLISL